MEDTAPAGFFSIYHYARGSLIEDAANKIYADDIKTYDTTGGWHNVTYRIHIIPERNRATDTTRVTNTDFRVWDKKCVS